MKRSSIGIGRFLAAAAVLFFMGCAGPEVVKEEEIAQKAGEAAPQAEAEKQPEAKPVEEAAAAPKAEPTEITVTAIPEETAPPAAEPAAEAGKQAAPAVVETAPAPGAVEGAQGAQRAESPEKVGFYAIYFDYDEFAIRDIDKDNLVRDAELLKKYPAVKAVIEGHADERGETEYNLALGDKRAKSVERYLKTLGINPVRLTTISYGEERPAVSGHDEAAWAKNRRVEFKAAE